MLHQAVGLFKSEKGSPTYHECPRSFRPIPFWDDRDVPVLADNPIRPTTTIDHTFKTLHHWVLIVRRGPSPHVFLSQPVYPT